MSTLGVLKGLRSILSSWEAAVTFMFLARHLQGGEVVLHSLVFDEPVEFLLSTLRQVPLVGDQAAQLVAVGEDLFGDPAVVTLAHLDGVLEGSLDGEIEPVLNGGGDELHGDEEEDDGGQERQGDKGRHQLGSDSGPHDLLFSLEEKLHQVPHGQEEEQQQQDDVQIDEGEDEDAVGDRQFEAEVKDLEAEIGGQQR